MDALTPEALRPTSPRILSALATVVLGATAIALATFAAGANEAGRRGALVGAAVLLALIFVIRRVNAARLVMDRHHLEVINPLRTDAIAYADIASVEVSRRGTLLISMRDGRLVACLGARSSLLELAGARSPAVEAQSRVRAAIANSQRSKDLPHEPSAARFTTAWLADAALASAVVFLIAALASR